MLFVSLKLKVGLNKTQSITQFILNNLTRFLLDSMASEHRANSVMGTGNSQRHFDRFGFT